MVTVDAASSTVTEVAGGASMMIVDVEMDDEIVLDRPTSVELAGGTAYIVTVTGDVFTIDDVPAPPYDTTS